MSVRCKFVCNEVSQQHYGDTSQWRYKFCAVTGNMGEGDEENKLYWKYTPSGTLEFQCMTGGQHPLFKVHQQYYIDITPAQSQIQKQEAVAS